MVSLGRSRTIPTANQLPSIINKLLMNHLVLHADKDDGETENRGESGEIDEVRKDDEIKVGEEDG